MCLIIPLGAPESSSCARGFRKFSSSKKQADFLVLLLVRPFNAVHRC